MASHVLVVPYVCLKEEGTIWWSSTVAKAAWSWHWREPVRMINTTIGPLPGLDCHFRRHSPPGFLKSLELRRDRRPYGYGKKRARCPKCGDLQDKETFHAQAVYPHPSSSFAMYYEPHWSWCCAKCYAKKEVPMMAREEYDRLFSEQLKEFYPTP